MTDIRRHLPVIVRVVRERVAATGEAGPGPLSPASYADLRSALAAHLPASYGIGRGMLVGADGRGSEPCELVLYDRTLPGADDAPASGRFAARQVIATIEIARRHTRATLAQALHRVATSKATRPSRPIPPGPAAPVGQPRARRVPKQLLPLAIVVFGEAAGLAGPGETEVFCVGLDAMLRAHPVEHRPDLLYALDRNLAYRTPGLDGRPHVDDEIGLTREPELTKPRTCYICDTKFARRHFFYERLCGPCGDRNYRKRVERADLSGRIALVTGARVKIGYAVALRLLRSGASVVATTRFPHDAALRYSREPDCAQWAQRLRIYGLDMRDVASVEAFADHLVAALPRLDALVNNAAQTVRRPPAYYAHLLAGELRPRAELPAQARELVGTPGAMGVLPAVAGAQGAPERRRAPALATQASLIAGDEDNNAALFPPGAYDRDLQQVDNRPRNSWTLRLDEVEWLEMVEVHLVNAVAPALLAGRLRPLLRAGAETHSRSHVVNVAAAEGQFVQDKRGVHPHTNMAKAALNMLTHTCAGDYQQDGILMVSVDPGWVSQQTPLPTIAASEPDQREPPLDLGDAAARVCDPIFAAATSGQPVTGVLLKDYAVAPW